MSAKQSTKNRPPLPTEVRKEKIGPGHPPTATQFKAGSEWRGNPGGRPKSKLISEALRKMLAEVEESGDKSGAERLAAQLISIATGSKAKPGSAVRAIEAIADRVEGKAVQGFRLEQPMDDNTAQRILDISLRLEGLGGGNSSFKAFVDADTTQQVETDLAQTTMLGKVD